MSAENVRAVLFRTLTDNDFYNLMLVNPDEALKDYDLTDDERRILATPDKGLYKALGEAGIAFQWPLILPIAIHKVPPSLSLKEDDEKIVQLVNSIQNAVGQDRFAKISQLVQKIQELDKITEELNQIRRDPPQNE